MKGPDSNPTKSPFWSGYRDCSPFILVVAPFGLLFGAVATEAGFNLLETMSMTILVIAGAAQFTALALLEEQAPTIIVVVTALAVNLRMAMYSAALVPHLGKASLGKRLLASYFMVDQTFAVSIKKYESEPGWALPPQNRLFLWLRIVDRPFLVWVYLAGCARRAIDSEGILTRLCDSDLLYQPDRTDVT